MRKTRILWTAVLAAAFAAGPGVSEAKRIGAKSSKSDPAPTKKVDDEETKASGSMALSPRLRLPVAAGTGAVAGAAAGGAAAAIAESAQQQPSPAEKQAEAAALAEQARQEKLSALESKATIEEAVKKAEQAAAAQKALTARLETERLMREQEAESKRRAEEDRQAMLRTKAIERDRSCVIRPVMSDEEIERCKWAWSVPPPG